MSRYVSKLQYWSLGYRTDSELCHARILGTVKGRGVVMFESNKERVKACYKNVSCITSLIDSM